MNTTVGTKIPTRTRIPPVPTVSGDMYTANNPHRTIHTGMTALRRRDIDMVASLSCYVNTGELVGVDVATRYGSRSPQLTRLRGGNRIT
jgi:hypothetical protein